MNHALFLEDFFWTKWKNNEQVKQVVVVTCKCKVAGLLARKWVSSLFSSTLVKDDINVYYLLSFLRTLYSVY